METRCLIYGGAVLPNFPARHFVAMDGLRHLLAFPACPNGGNVDGVMAAVDKRIHAFHAQLILSLGSLGVGFIPGGGVGRFLSDGVGRADEQKEKSGENNGKVIGHGKQQYPVVVIYW